MPCVLLKCIVIWQFIMAVWQYINIQKFFLSVFTGEQSCLHEDEINHFTDNHDNHEYNRFQSVLFAG